MFRLMLIVYGLVICWDSTQATAIAGVPGIKIKPTNNIETSEYPEIHAIIGSTVSLPCNLSPPSEDDTISLVLWYRLDLPNPIYTLDARSASSADAAKHFSSKALGSRAYFNITHSLLAHLRINPIEEDDTGEYRCRVDFKRGRTLSRMVKLNVIVPVKRIVIKGKGNITYSGMIGPFKEGETLTLICEARGGFPTPVLTWRRGSRILPSTTSVDEQGIVRSELIFTNIRREDLLTVLTCQGSNNNITGPIYTSVTVDMNLKPQRIQITSLLSALKAGEQVEVNCQTEGSRPPARISWRKGPERIDHMAIQNIFGSITVSTLSFKASAADHGKLLICEAQNPKLPESALQDSWMLNVLYPPQLSLVFGASEQYEHLREGSDVYFECNIQANPAVTDVKWKFQGRHLNPNPLKGIVILNHSLLLHNVSRYHRGMYQCQAFNAQGKGKSEEVVLRIQYAPVCSEKQRQSYGVAKNEEIDVSCSVDSDPQDIVFWWIFNNTGAETRTIKTFDNNLMKNRSIVKFAPETQMDYGALYCFAKNSVGTINEPCIFHIVPTGPPESLQNCSIMNQTFNSLSFLCEVGDDGGMKQTFHLEVYSMRKELLLANITQYESPNFTVRNLPAGTAFVIAIYSSNNKGRSSTVVLTAATLYSTAMQIEEKNRSIIGIVLLVSLAAVGTLALLAAAALVTVFKNKARSPTREAASTRHEMIQKTSNSQKPTFENGNPCAYHGKEVTTEYIHLSQSASECIYEQFMSGRTASFETVLCKAHVLNEEGLEVIIPVIER